MISADEGGEQMGDKKPASAPLWIEELMEDLEEIARHSNRFGDLLKSSLPVDASLTASTDQVPCTYIQAGWTRETIISQLEA